MKVVIPGLLLLVSSVFGQTRIDNVTATQVPFVNVERIWRGNCALLFCLLLKLAKLHDST